MHACAYTNACILCFDLQALYPVLRKIWFLITTCYLFLEFLSDDALGPYIGM